MLCVSSSRRMCNWFQTCTTSWVSKIRHPCTTLTGRAQIYFNLEECDHDKVQLEVILGCLTMNLNRFQLALNHDDPNVVSTGLNEFKVHVLLQHDAVSSIGYHGRGCATDMMVEGIVHPVAPSAIQGLLLEYVRKSPQIEELFVLWALPGRDDDRALSAAHMSCIAAILHCSTSEPLFCNAVVSRILCDHMKSLHSQLASGNVELIHSTLGLLLAMMRTSQQNCKDVFQKLNLSNPALDAVIQKGKAVNFQSTKHKHSIATDSRLLVILLVLLVLEASDATAVLELFAEKSLMRKVMHSIGRDSVETLQIVLPGVLWALKQNAVLAPHVHDIFDGATIRQLVLLYSHKDEAAQVLAQSFLLELLAYLKQPASKRGKVGGGASVAGSISKCCGYIAQYLQPHADSRQEEVLMVVLSIQPHLLNKSISNISALKSWDPVPSSEYLGIMRYLTQLLQAAAIDGKAKAQLRAAFAPAGTVVGEAKSDAAEATESGEANQKQNPQGVLNALLNSWIPPGLTKKDICKMISHKELSLQRVGLQYVHALATRLQRAITEAGLSSSAATAAHRHGAAADSAGSSGASTSTSAGAMLEHCVAAAIQAYLPEFQLLVNLRAKYVKQLAESKEENGERKTAQPVAEVAPVVPAVVDDFDFNIEGADQQVVAVAAKAELEKLATAAAESEGSNVYESLYVLLLQVVETFMSLSPQSVTTVKFDMLRLLDDFVPWESSTSCAQMQEAAQKLNPNVLLAILKLLRQATTSIECRWFGSQEDAVKMLINLIVSEDWRQSLKRSVLMKLMVLASPANDGDVAVSADMEEISRRARSLLKSVLIQSGLFVGHGMLDLELTTELHAWMGNLSAADDSILVTESLLRITHHWNTEIGILSAQSLAKSGRAGVRQYAAAIGLETDSDEELALMPYSPLLFASMLLLSGNFQVFASLLPKHIKTHIQAASSEGVDAGTLVTTAFFDKYTAQFRRASETVFSSVFCKVLGQVRAPSDYVASVHAGLVTAASGTNLANMPTSTVTSVVALLEVVQCSAASKATAEGKKTPKKGAGPVPDAQERLRVVATSAPEVYDALLSLLNPSSQAVVDDKKKKSSAKKVGKSSAGDAESALNKALLRIDLYAALMAGLILHAAQLSEASASPALSSFVANNLKVILSVQLSRSCECDAKFISWAQEAWCNHQTRAEGLHAKALLLHDALRNLQLVSVLVGDKSFQFSAQGELSLKPAQDEVSAAPGSARKRTQSDLSAESNSVAASAFLPWCQAFVRAALEILQSPVGVSPTVAVILSNSALVDGLLQAGWYGQWERRLFRTVGAAARARKQSTHLSSRKRIAAALVQSSDGTMNALWRRLGEKIVAADATALSPEATQELQALATVITQLVDLPALRKLVVDSSVSEQSHAVLGQMLLVPFEAVHGAPQLSAVEGIMEDVLRSAPLTQIVRSVLEVAALTQSEAVQNSALFSTIYRDEDPTNDDVEAYYFDPLSLVESVETAAAAQSSWLFLRNSFLRPTEQALVKKSKLTAEQVLRALRFEAVLPAELVRGGSSVTEVAGLLVKKWDNLPVSAQVAPHSVLADVVALIAQEAAEEPSAALRAQLLSLVATITADSGVHYVLAQYLAYVAQMSTTSWSALVPMVLAERLLSASQHSDAGAEAWARAFCAVVVSSIDACLSTLSELSSETITNSARAGVFDALAVQLEDVEYLLSSRFSSSSLYADVLQESTAALKKKFNKLIKASLKAGLESASGLRFIATFQRVLHASGADGEPTLLGAVLQPTADDFYLPDTLLGLIPGHSKFASILSIGKDTHHPAKLPLLKLLLQLVLIVHKDRDTGRKKRKEKIEPIAQYFLADALVSVYGGTLSEADRVCLRILTILSEANRCPAVCTLQPRAVGGVLTAAGARTAEEMLVDSARWLVEGITPPMTYSTLARYPLWRSLAPQPLHHLESAFVSASKKSIDKSSVEREWKGGDETDMEVDEDGDRVSDAGERDDDVPTTPNFDSLLQCSDKVLDPAFYIPAMFFVLRNREVSIRQMANSGALSLLIAALGSSCPALRSCALACLQFVLNMLHQQNPTRDAAFRERAQLVLLLNYVRNSFGSAELVAPHLPLTTAIFLGRAAMNVMQPNHELFGRVNKYLLNRPFCDPKDVPLYDLLLVNGDAQSDQMQRLSALRLFRDGLFTKQDHLNLCRKNAYNRLMLLFPLLAKDTRAGHAVLDLLDRGLCMKVSARYLLERCRVSAWVKLLAAPMSAMHLTATTELEGLPGQATRKSVEGVETAGLAHYSKYLVRALTLLRRVIAAGYLLACEDEKTKSHLQDVYMICIAVANDAVMAVNSGYADGIPAEFFVQLVLCMWDLSLVLQKTTSTGAALELWNINMLRGLYHAIQVKFSRAQAQTRSYVNQDELSLSLLLLMRFSVVDADCDDLFSHIRRLSQHLLLPLPATQLTEKGAVAIMASAGGGSSKKKLFAHEVTLHHILDNPAQLPYYTNTVHYLAAIMGSTSLGIEDFDIQSHFEFSWTTLAGTDLINMTALPTSLGRRFVLSSAADIFASREHAATVDSLAYTRWALLMHTAFMKSGSDNGAPHARAGAADSDILSKESVSHAVLPSSGLRASAGLCLVAAIGLSGEAADVPIGPDVVSALAGMSSSLADVTSGTPVEAFSEQLKVENLVTHAFDFMSAVVTLADHPSSRDGAIGASFKALLESRAAIVSMLCTPAAGTLAVEDRVSAQHSAMQVFLREALVSTSTADASASTATQKALLGVGATYMPLQYTRQVMVARTSRGPRLGKESAMDGMGEHEEEAEAWDETAEPRDDDADDADRSVQGSDEEGVSDEEADSGDSGDESEVDGNDSDIGGAMDEN